MPIMPIRKKGDKKDKNAAPAHTEIQREMFSKAASRIAQIVTKQRQQEADRLVRKLADAELISMEKDAAFHPAVAALKLYCDEYRVASEAAGEFRIRPSQISGWNGIVKRWAGIKDSDPEKIVEARIQAVKEAQNADEEKKFGDVNLFFRLAEERFFDSWHRPDGRPDSKILECFVKGMKARSDAEGLKVAAYRHPDPYLNPIFCQFGVSRPGIQFRRLRAFDNAPAANDPRAVGMLLWHPNTQSGKMTLMYGVSLRLDDEIGSACDAVLNDSQSLVEIPRRGRLGAAAGGLVTIDSPARVAGVFDVKVIANRKSDDTDNEDHRKESKLKEPKWNGTLSARRSELAAIRKLLDKGDVSSATHRRDQLRWTLTISMEMQGRGPWFRYVEAAKDQAAFTRTVRKDKSVDKNDWTKGLVEQKGDKRIDAIGWPWQEYNKPLKDNRDATALVDDVSATRGHKACVMLSRLPGLRVLSVDLGHRFAASCAVWEAISSDEMKREIGKQTIRFGGMGKDDLFCHVERPTDKLVKNGRKKGQHVTEITVYRRIGEDFLRDPKTGKATATPHPAPWARLDRQFFIKLQGEEHPARAATNGKLMEGATSETNEVEMVANLARDLGLCRENVNEARGRGVDELMRHAMRIATVGLKRHGRMAKIAYAFKPDCPGIPGMGGAITLITRGDPEHVKFLTNALTDWHAVATDTEWDGSAARKLWNKHITPLLHDLKIGEPSQPDPDAEPCTPLQPVKGEQELHEQLKSIAKHFATRDPESTRDIYSAWAKLWAENDGIERNRDEFEHTLIRDESGKVIGSRTAPKIGKDSPRGWHATLRLLTDWIMGRHLPGAPSNHWNRNVGGLSLTRIATMRSLYQLHKAFAMRPRPDKVQGAPQRGESNAGVAQSILDAMERMREQRVKQIASRIVEAALGIGIERPRVWDEVKNKWRYPKRPRGMLYHVDEHGVEQGDPRFKPCHAVVIENLRNYRPDELQVRRENRALMNWSAGKVRKYLEEACQLHGLHLREVMPNYTSRQCSRSGLPGVRCEDVPVDAKTGLPSAYWWNKAIASARKKTGNSGQNEKKGDAESRMLVAIADHLTMLKTERKPLPEVVRIPRNGGDLFVAAPPWLCRVEGHQQCPLCDPTRAIQADLNAAANIGLRALLDPDFSGKWWYVPAGMDNGGYRVPAPKSCAGAVCLDGWKVAPKDSGFSADGAPLAVVNDESVKQAEEVATAAKKELDAIKKAKKKGSVDQASLDRAKKRHEEAKTALKEAKKSASQKEIINLWQDAKAARSQPASGRWHETTAYWRIVRTRVIARLWTANGLVGGTGTENDGQVAD